MMIDLATRYRITETLFVYPHGENKAETADMMIKTITTRWLMSMPRPKMLVPDNANTLVSYKVTEFMADLGIEVLPPLMVKAGPMASLSELWDRSRKRPLSFSSHFLNKIQFCR